MRPRALIAGSVAVACGSHGSSSAPLASHAALDAAAAASVAVSSPTLAPSAPAPYDLAADLAARLEGARAEFGDTTPSDVEAGVFLLVAVCTTRASSSRARRWTPT
jgi:L-alanine-DL-glutamate epimerase-like enolase superfamily enzyme